ncbi:MAG: mersacidin/lichenicidin family type 2 lantibiotic [Leptolyngbyaceae cyanobacterium CRU_2_3]|nr:mersacidin/lichenicidin family type 2 lantibiotic [Leptolyngbyaceae cyanobacterium CRU_2_3]
MSHENIIQAWKDESFRNSLSDDLQALLPENPAGLVQLTDAELGTAAGGFNSCVAGTKTRFARMIAVQDRCISNIK